MTKRQSDIIREAAAVRGDRWKAAAQTSSGRTRAIGATDIRLREVLETEESLEV